MVDGCMDAYADDIFACGARGIISEPFTDYKAIARKHENGFLAGEGDNRILMRNNPDKICAMVEDMVKTAYMADGYMMSVGNRIPRNVPPRRSRATRTCWPNRPIAESRHNAHTP